MKKKLPMLMTQKFNQTTGFVSSVQKNAVFFIGLLLPLMLLSFKSFAQTDGAYRSYKNNNGNWASSGTWEVYYASQDIWVQTGVSAWAANTAYVAGKAVTNGGNLYVAVVGGTSGVLAGAPTGTGTGIVDGTVTWNYVGTPPALAPSATTNIYIPDGAAQISNASGCVAGSITVGQGNAFSGTAVLAGNGVSSVTINNPGALMGAPGLTFLGAGTTQAVGTVTFKMAGAYYRNKGAGYTTATVTVGSAWAPKASVTATTQKTYGGNVYTCKTGGVTSALGGPTGTGTGIADSTVVWDYAGTAPTAHAIIDAGKISGIVVDNAGSGYNSFPSLTITGDGAGASYAIQMGIDNIKITNGGNYTVAPQVVFGSYLIVGSNANARKLTVSGDVTFKNGSNLVSGGGTASLTDTLSVGGNLTAESPISFNTVVPTSTSPSTSTTTVFFTKAGTATILGAGSMAFQKLNVGSTTTLVNNGTITISGKTNFHDILGFTFATPAVTGIVDTVAHTVALGVPAGTNVAALVPTITLRNGTTVSPLSGIIQDFTNPVTYITTAPGGTVTQAWTVTVTIAVPPSAPNATAATGVTSTDFAANWAAAASATGYRLDVATDNGFANMVTGFSDKDVANVTTFAVTGLTAGTTYYYRVRAYNAVGTSASSNVITVAVVPAAPVASAATNVALTGLTANWAASVGATGYYLDVATDNAFANKLTNYSNLQVTSGTSATVTGLTAGTTYYYQVRAYNTGGTSDNSSVITAITVPAAPIANDATDITKISFSANWAASTGATGYYLDVATNTAFTSILPDYNNKDVSTVTTFPVAGLTAATTYYYRVRAYNTGGTSASSNTKTVLSLGTGVQSITANGLGIAVKANAVELESSNTIASVQVVTINGKLVTEKNVGATKATIGTEGWNTGVYVFTIKTQSEVIVKKISIVK